MRAYRPSAPFNVAFKLLIPQTSTSHGVTVKTYTDVSKAPLSYGTFRTFGGTEALENDVYTVLDTATIETWYRPDLTAGCRLYMCDTGETYDVIGTPEDIQMRHQYLTFKVQKVGGLA